MESRPPTSQGWSGMTLGVTWPQTLLLGLCPMSNTQLLYLVPREQRLLWSLCWPCKLLYPCSQRFCVEGTARASVWKARTAVGALWVSEQLSTILLHHSKAASFPLPGRGVGTVLFPCSWENTWHTCCCLPMWFSFLFKLWMHVFVVKMTQIIWK